MSSALLSVQSVKSYLVRLGPQNPLVRTALWMYARQKGFRLSYSLAGIHIQRDGRSMILNRQQFVQVPIMMECFDLFFSTIRVTRADGMDVLDFSQPGLHEYSQRGVSFHFPSVPEDDVMEAYTKEYVPQPGDVVWDAGAHAGATAFFLSQMVGPEGRVYAFEPDESNYAYLLKNLGMHGVSNVLPVKKALSGSTGRAVFNMDGTMSAGIDEYLVYSDTGRMTEVETITIAEACRDFQSVPRFIKMDIEGAEVAAVEGSGEFLSRQSIHFAIESYHRLGETYTYTLLDGLFPRIGYQVKSENFCGQMFTWASKT
jgi:FkbM family methyltransferase